MVTELAIQGRDAAELMKIMPGMGMASGLSQSMFSSLTTQNNTGPSAEHLREMIVGLSELVASVVRDAGDVEAERDMALMAASDGAVNQKAIQRFASWVLAAMRNGASAAITSVARSGTDELLHEAGRLTGHL